MPKRKGVSELLGSLLMIMITVAGFGIVSATVAPHFANQGQSVLSLIHKNQLALQEMTTVVYTAQQDGVVYSYIYNYGTAPATPEIVFVNTQPYYQFGSLMKAMKASTAWVSYGSVPFVSAPLPPPFSAYNNAHQGGLTMVFYANFTGKVTFNANFDDGGDIFYSPVGSNQWYSVFGQWTRQGTRTISVTPGEYKVAVDYYLNNPGAGVGFTLSGINGVSQPISAIGWNMSSNWNGNTNQLYHFVSENPADPIGGSGENQILEVVAGPLAWSYPSSGSPANYFMLTYLNGTQTSEIPPHTMVRLTVYLPQNGNYRLAMLTTSGSMVEWNTTQFS